jgi:hypothetical protein
MRRKGISGVVVAVLLTVIGIAAVLLFWGTISGLIGGKRLQGNIDSASILVVEGKTPKLVLTISNAGTVDFKVTSIKLDTNDLDLSKCQPNMDLIPSGGSVTYTCDCSAQAGSSYILTVVISGGGKQSTLTTSVYARQG